MQQKVSSNNATICNLAQLAFPAFKSLIMWTDPFNAMANSNGLAHINKDRVLSSVHGSSVYIVQLCTTGIL